jgi:outer membrane receptor protein involved in Fe transport
MSERYIGKRHSNFEGETSSPDFKLPAYAVTDLQSGMDFAHIRTSLFVRNVFDRRGLLGAQTAYVPLGGTVQATVLQPRTVGFEVNVPF